MTSDRPRGRARSTRHRASIRRVSTLWKRRCSLERLEGRFLLATWSGTLADGTIWGATPGEVEVVTGNLDVPAGSTLTILPGAIVKFQSTRRLDIAGTVVAEGTAKQPIHLTSYTDDSAGGDTNGDGSATGPSPGNWGGIGLTAETADVQLTHASVRFAGFLRPSIQVVGGQFGLSNVFVGDSSGTALQFGSGATGTYDLSDVSLADIGSSSSHFGVLVSSNDATINSTNLTIDNVAGRHVQVSNAGRWNSTGTLLSGTGVKAIAFEGGTITDVRAWDDTAVYYLSNAVSVAEGGSLTVAAGAVVKADIFGRLIVDGEFNVVGTVLDPVVFTSIHDDSVGGDTNGNGAATTPAPGNWANITIDGSAGTAQVEYLHVYFTGFGSRSAIELSAGALTLRDSLVEDSSSHGVAIVGGNAVLERNRIRDVGGFGLNIQTPDGVVTLTDTMVENAAGGAYIFDPKTELIATGTMSTDSGRADAIVVDGAGISHVQENLVWQEDLTYLVLDQVSILNGASLTVLPGTVVKHGFSFNTFTVAGTLNALGTVAEPIIFTSQDDDTVGGDTNEDGGATTPGNSRFRIVVTGATNLDRVELRHLGFSGFRAIDVLDGELRLTNSLVVDTSTDGVTIGADVDGVDLSGTTIRDVNGVGVVVATTSNAPVFLNGLFVENATGVGVRMASQANVDLTAATFANTSRDGAVLIFPPSPINVTRTWTGGQTYVIGSGLGGNLVVDPAGHLTIGAGAVIKFNQFRGVQVNGKLTAIGSESAPVLFTSLTDDTGGDSNNDGNATVPFAGDWFNVWQRDAFATGTAVADLRNVQIHYAGGENAFSSTPALLIDAGNVTLSSVEICHALDVGLRSRRSGDTIVTGEDVTICDTGGAALSFGETAVGGGNISLVGVHLQDIFGDAVRIDPELVTLHLDDVTMENIGGLPGERVIDSPVRKGLALGHTGLVVLQQGIDVQAGGAIEFLPGTIVKVADDKSIVGRDGRVTANGTAQQRILFTSIHDDTAGGDTNDDGVATTPSRTDWGGIEMRVSGSRLDHAEIRYANAVGAAIVVDVDDGATAPSPGGPAAGNALHTPPPPFDVTMHGVFTTDVYAFVGRDGNVSITNSLMYLNDTNSSVFDWFNSDDLWLTNNTIHGGVVGANIECRVSFDGCQPGEAPKLVFSNNNTTGYAQAGIRIDSDQPAELVTRNNNTFSPSSSTTIDDVQGNVFHDDHGGNISADPLYGNPATSNFKLGAGSPSIDAAHGGDAPPRDAFGNLRHDHTLVPNTGSGIIRYADIGYVENQQESAAQVIVSAFDFADLQDGTIQLTVTLRNDGTGATDGPLTVDHYLAPVVSSGTPALLMGTSVVSATLNPGEETTVVDTFPVPPRLRTGEYNVVASQTHTQQTFPAASTVAQSTFDHQADSLPTPGTVDRVTEATHLFEFTVPPRTTLRITFDSPTSSALIVSSVDRGNAGARELVIGNPLTPGIGGTGQIVVPNATDLPLTGVAVARFANVGVPYSVATEFVADVLNARQNAVGNVGEVTVQFDNVVQSVTDIQAQLGAGIIRTIAFRQFNDGALAATFDFNDAAPQAATFVATLAPRFESTDTGVDVGGAFTVGDANGDGILDVVVASPAGIDVFQGDGNGNLNVGERVIANMRPIVALRVAHADEDNRPDIIAAYSDTFGGEVVYFEQHGDGTYAPASTIGNNVHAIRVELADFNCQQTCDLVAVDTFGTRTLLTNNADGTFGQQQVNNGPAATADFDGDGDQDAFVKDDTGGVSIRENVDGALGDPQSLIPPNPDRVIRQILIKDIDGDMHDDIVVVSEGADEVGAFIDWYRNDGSNQFPFPPTQIAESGLSDFIDVSAVDKDGDGDCDIVSDTTSNLSLEAGPTQTSIEWFANDGTGKFSDGISASTGVDTVRFADLNNDGRFDFVGVGQNRTLHVALNPGPTQATTQIAVIDAHGPDITCSIDQTPSTVRVDRLVQANVSCTNFGNVDGQPPVLVFDTSQDVDLIMGTDPLGFGVGEPIVLMYDAFSTGADNFPLGATVEQSFLFVPTTPGPSSVDVFVVYPTNPILSQIGTDWDAALRQSLPAGAKPEDVDAVASGTQDALGDSFGDVYQEWVENVNERDFARPRLGDQADHVFNDAHRQHGAGELSQLVSDTACTSLPDPPPDDASNNLHRDFVLIIAPKDSGGTTRNDDRNASVQSLLNFYENHLNICGENISVLVENTELADIKAEYERFVRASDENDKIKIHYIGFTDVDVDIVKGTAEAVLVGHRFDETIAVSDLAAMFTDTPMPGELLFVVDGRNDSRNVATQLGERHAIPRLRAEYLNDIPWGPPGGEQRRDRYVSTDWVRAQTDPKNDWPTDGDDDVYLSEALLGLARDIETSAGARGDKSVDQKLHDDVGDAARKSVEQPTTDCPPVPGESPHAALGPGAGSPAVTTLANCLRTHASATDTRELNVVGSFDPNEKAGPVGIGPENYTADTRLFPYTIYFENDPAMATAPAQVVNITDQLSADLDWGTFEFGSVSFGDRTIRLQGGRTLATARVSLIETGLGVDIEARFDRLSGVATWTFTTIDPRTNALTQDPLAGFLPPNVTKPEGEGNVQYRVSPRGDVTTGTQIANAASIVFDTNDPIITNTHIVTFDFAAPESAVDPLSATVGPSFVVSWSGTDAGSGIATYDIFVSEDGGPFTLWLDDTTDTSGAYAGQIGRAYGFYSVATDRVGHMEALPAAADTETTVPELPADFSGDLAVGLLDLAILQQNLGATGATLAMGDLDGNGIVNRLDAVLFSWHYGRAASPPSPAAAAIVDRAVTELSFVAYRAAYRFGKAEVGIGVRPSYDDASSRLRAKRTDRRPIETRVSLSFLETAISAARRRRLARPQSGDGRMVGALGLGGYGS